MGRADFLLLLLKFVTPKSSFFMYIHSVSQVESFLPLEMPLRVCMGTDLDMYVLQIGLFL